MYCKKGIQVKLKDPDVNLQMHFEMVMLHVTLNHKLQERLRLSNLLDKIPRIVKFVLCALSSDAKWQTPDSQKQFAIYDIDFMMVPKILLWTFSLHRLCFSED